MAGVRFNIVFDSKKWSKKVNQIMGKELKKSLLQATLFVETKVAEKTPVGIAGTLRTGITGIVIRGRGIVKPSSATAAYADIVERGRRPGTFPPVDAITLWVKRVIAPPAKKLKSISFLVGRKIKKFGFDGAAMFFTTENDPSVRFRVTRFIEEAKRKIEKRASNL